jgi:hypothetical protein
MDMNLGNQEEESGLDVIEREAIQSNAILVTNDFECAEVLERAAKIALPVLPKPILAQLAANSFSRYRTKNVLEISTLGLESMRKEADQDSFEERTFLISVKIPFQSTS